jgi:hypothetical protein
MALFGCQSDFSVLGLQAGEMAHKAHVKEAMYSTNCKDWEVQIMTVHTRKEASIHNTQRLAGEQSIPILYFAKLRSFQLYFR